MMTALAARYEVITHDISSMLAEKRPCMCGRATLVMLVSSTCITVTIITEKVMAHFRAELIGASVGGAGGGVTRAGTRSSPDASAPLYVRSTMCSPRVRSIRYIRPRSSKQTSLLHTRDRRRPGPAA